MNGTGTRVVTDFQMPICRYGFRSGWAYATVDGVEMRLYTSRSDRTDYREHADSIKARFKAGVGEAVQA